MTELDRARKHLLGVQRELRMARAGHFNDEWIAAAETCFLAALSWVWEEQEKEETVEIVLDWRAVPVCHKPGCYFVQVR